MQRRVVKPQRPVYGGGRSQAPKPYRPTVTWANFKSFVKVAAGVGALIYVFNVFRIKNIAVEGAGSLPPELVRTKTESIIRKGFFNDNLLTLRAGKATKDLIETEPLIKTATLERNWPNKLTVIIEERRPSLNWTSGNQTYLLDGDGTVIGPTTEPGLANVVDTTNLPVKAGERVAPRRFVEFVSSLSAQIPSAGVKIVSFRVPDTTSEVYAQTESGYIIKFDTTRGAAEQLEDLRRVLATLSKLRKTPAEYIDLRIPNKAYYR
jgi:cell division septal protein FtsQ